MTEQAVTAIRDELNTARSLYTDWERRGKPVHEQAQVETRLTLATKAAAEAVNPNPPVHVQPGFDADKVARRFRDIKMQQQQSALPALPELTAGPVSVRYQTPQTSQPPPLSPADAAALDHEADVRFWAQTGVAPGKKLDPKNPLDAAMIPTWIDVYGKVKREWQSGRIQWTHADPVVTKAITVAQDHTEKAAQHLDAAVAAKAAGDHEAAQKHVEDAHARHEAAAQAVQEAAARQPPTVSHRHHREGARRIRYFVMNASGQGVPVDGQSASFAIQATGGPAPGAADAPPVTAVSDGAHEEHSGLSTGEKIGIVGAVLGALGLTIYAVRK